MEPVEYGAASEWYRVLAAYKPEFPIVRASRHPNASKKAHAFCGRFFRPSLVPPSIWLGIQPLLWISPSLLSPWVEARCWWLLAHGSRGRRRRLPPTTPASCSSDIYFCSILLLCCS